jgi:hypothetical protein
MKFQLITRRWFLKKTGIGTISLSGVMSRFLRSQSSEDRDVPRVGPREFIAALGDSIIPTAEGYPGYRRLEQYGITEEVLKGLQGIEQREFNAFNAAPREFFKGRSFVDLGQSERTEFLQRIANSFPAGSFGEADSGAVSDEHDPGQLVEVLGNDVLQTVQKVFRLVRIRVFTLFYQNFPEHKVPRDGKKIPVLQSGDQHQIINPNTSDLVTGWDVANFPGPLSWAEEQERRAKWMKIHWHS